MGTLHHHPMITHIGEKDLRQSLATMIAPETNKKGITSLGILMFILITRKFITMNINHGIEKHVLFVDYIIMYLLITGK